MGHPLWNTPWESQAGGAPPWVSQLFGPDLGLGFGSRPTSRRRHGPRVRRGDVRTAILDVLHTAAEPVNGYQVIQQIAERTEGVWKPSPGSVYPTIAQLQDEGLLEDAPTGRKAVQLTDEGRSWVADHAEELAAVWAPFEAQADDEEAVGVKQVIGQTIGAVVQVMSTGTPEQRERAVRILADTRRQLYGLLAEGPEGLEDEDE
ncbi:MAG: PadR family transcriptional regulator [Marmoricola sp.]